MRKHVVLTGLLMPLVILVVGLATTARGAILFDRAERDLGFVYRDEPQKLVYRLTNSSTDTLRIYGIEPSCDCTTAQVVPEAIAPGDTGRVLVFFDPMGYEGRGRIQEYVRVTTSDVDDIEIMLLFWVEVGIGPEPSPRALSFGRICKGSSDTLLVSISPAPGEVLDVLEARSDTACLAVEPVPHPAEDAHTYRVIATNMEGCGRVATLVTFETSDRLRPEIRIPVTVSLVGRIMIEPDIIAFGPTLPGSYVAQVVKIHCPDGTKFSIPKAVSSVEHLEPEVKQMSDTTCELRLKVKEGAPPGRVSGDVTLHTDCPDEPSLDIKVNGYIRSE